MNQDLNSNYNQSNDDNYTTYQMPNVQKNNQYNNNYQQQPINQPDGKHKKRMKTIIIITVIVIALIASGILLVFNKKNNTQIQLNEMSIVDSLWKDYNSGNITIDEYVKYMLYADYDSDLLSNKYKSLKNVDLIEIDDFIAEHYSELSNDTLRYYAEKINLKGITFELDKENETANNKVALSNLLFEEVHAATQKTTNLNKALLSKNGNFVVWYTTTGDSAIDYNTAKKVADGLESSVQQYTKLFGYNYSFNSNVISKGKTYNNQLKVLQSSNIDTEYLESAMQVYIVNYNHNSKAKYYYGTGKGREIINSILGGDEFGSIIYPYILIKPSAFDDYERLEQIYNHELFHHYQHEILCGQNNCSMSSDPYYADSTANWASSLITNKTTLKGFLNEWADVYRYNSNSLFGRYINEYGEEKAAYAIYVYLYNYSSIVENGVYKIIQAMYKDNFLEYLEKNSTLEERKKIQKEIAIKNLTLNYTNNNLNVPIENRSMSNINDAINIKKNDVILEEVGIGKNGIAYYNINLSENEALKIIVEKDNKYVDVILVAQDENDDFVIIDNSDNKGNEIAFDTNDYKNYRRYYVIIYNNNITLQNYYSLTIKPIQKSESKDNSTNEKYISFSDCNGISDEVSGKIDTYYFDDNGKAYKEVITLFFTDEADIQD